jgi:hypothetical protein
VFYNRTLISHYEESRELLTTTFSRVALLKITFPRVAPLKTTFSRHAARHLI